MSDKSTDVPQRQGSSTPGAASSPGSQQRLGAREKVLRDINAKLAEAKELEQKAQELRDRADTILPPPPPPADSGDGDEAAGGASAPTPAITEEQRQEAEALRREAWELSQNAQKQVRAVVRLQSGAFQGGAAGAGIGAGIASGLGTLVGGLVGGLTAIPTTGLGLLIGAGAGLVHGPWVKVVEDEMKKVEEEKKEDNEDGTEGVKGLDSVEPAPVSSSSSSG
jgi:hypothetical protein